MIECDQLTVTVLVDNYIDMLMTNTSDIRRQGMPEHFGAKRGVPLAENGISFFIRATTKGRTTTILFDAGMSEGPIIHNADVLGIDLAEVDQVVLSHGHPDHFGGIYAALRAIGRRVPVIVHPSAFLPRTIERADVTLQYFNRMLTEDALREAGGGLVPVRSPLPIAPGVTTSGEIATTQAFEEEVPAGRLTIRDGHVHPDPIEDYMSLIFNVRGLGLVVFDPCGHAGVISSIDHARELTGVTKVHGVLGGFHLGHAGITDDKIARTVSALQERDVKFIAPMHCSGFRAQRAVAEALPDAFQMMTVGAEITFESENNA
jgi:7,8-dihydropterin-6-yl-methyl-4-(beta-D-ribofuranosyl)aminobenzene 5'-phosphate synthase